MSIDNPGDFYRAENFGEENNDNRPVTIYGNQLFRKAVDVLNISRTISDLLPEEEEDEHVSTTKGMMRENSMLLPGKVKAAQATDLYSLKMEHAVIIKVTVLELKNQIWLCGELHNVDAHYTQVLTDEIAAFKAIFINWIKSFDKLNDVPDDWHIFNDPTSFPGDDEPFDAEDFLGKFLILMMMCKKNQDTLKMAKRRPGSESGFRVASKGKIDCIGESCYFTLPL